MTREPDPSVGGDKAEAAEDAELGRVLEAYLADLEAGQTTGLGSSQRTRRSPGNCAPACKS